MAAGTGKLEFEVAASHDRGVSLQELPEHAWMVRPCEWYNEEYKDCKSIRARFHQYFIYGETISCDHWKEDYDNCMVWRRQRDLDYLNKVIDSELRRKDERKQAALANDVWEPRNKPPDDWNKPLPEWMQKQNENTFLQVKQLEREGKIPPSPLASPNTCTIL